MKTVQDYIKELDKERLIECYLHYITLERYELKSLADYTIGELGEKAKAKVTEYVDRLANLDITPSKHGKTGIVLASEIYKNPRWDTTLDIVLVFKEDVLKKEVEMNKYGFEFVPQTEIMGFFVADNKYTQDNIYDVIVQVMCEASFFGYEQEELQTAIDDLNEAIWEVERGETVDASDVFDQIRREHGIPIPEKDEVQDGFKREIVKAIYEYDKYNFERELLRLKVQLEREENSR